MEQIRTFIVALYVSGKVALAKSSLIQWIIEIDWLTVEPQEHIKYHLNAEALHQMHSKNSR